MATVLVTGGAGFMGSHVADALLALGHEVVVFDDLSGGFAENVPEAARFVEGDVADPAAVARVFADHPIEYVWHLAAYAAEGLSHFIRRFNYTNNLIGSVNLVNESVTRDVKCFAFASSIAVYGAIDPPMRESDTPRPEDPYGIAKLAVEQDLAAAHEMFGLDTLVFRPHNVYGERQNIGDRYRNVVGIFMNCAMQGKALPVFGDGEQQRAFTHIDDVAPVLARALFEPGAYNEVYNVGADEPVTVNRLAGVVREAMGADVPVERLAARSEVKLAWSDHAKLRERLGYAPSISIEDGIRRTAAWAKEHGARRSKSFGSLEVERNLPPSWRDA